LAVTIRLSGLLTPDRIQLDLRARCKEDVLGEIGSLAHRALPEVSGHEVRELLLEREKLASTGIGDGIAVPHARLGAVRELLALLVTVPQGVEFDAVDGRPVDVVVALLGPSSAGDPLKALAKVSRFLRDASLRRKLLAATDPASAFEAIRAQESAR
jgi:nitrogen PTS system EIIA component